MPMIEKTRLTSGFYFLIFIATIGVSLWSYYADPIINVDGILYLNSASALATGDFQEALFLHKWPFYAYLISLIHSVSGLDLEYSAHLLNWFLNFVACIGFACLIAELGGDRKTVLIGILVITFFPGLNEIRSDIIRDHGYIAFYIWALYFLIRSLDLRNWIQFGISFLIMSVAVLFRIEGMVFLIAMPIIYMNSRPDALPMNRLNFYLLIIVTTIVLIMVFGWWLYNPTEKLAGEISLTQNVINGWNQAITYLDNKIESLKRNILGTSSDTTGRWVYLWTVSGIIFTQVLIILSIPNALLSVFAFHHHLVFPNHVALRPWKLFILFNLIILGVFTLTKLFLTDRYPLALAVTLLAAVPFALSEIHTRWKSKPRQRMKSKLGYFLLAFVLLVNAFEGLTSRTDKHYLKKAGHWIEENTSPDASLYTNNLVLGYYSRKSRFDLEVEPEIANLIRSFYRGEWIHYDYLAIQVKQDPEFERHLQKTLWVVPEKVIVKNMKREIRIYNIKKYRERENQ